MKSQKRQSRVPQAAAHGQPVAKQACGATLIDELRKRKTALRPKEFALMLSVSERQITALVKAGRLPGYKIGGSVRVDPGAAAAWLEQRRTS